MDKSEEQSANNHQADTIIAMALDFVGINKIDMRQPLAQSGVLTLAGNDEATARNFLTKLSPRTRILFPNDDYGILMPVLPNVLVNGCEGSGTGWSSFIPRYNTTELSDNLRRLFTGQSMVPMDPCYGGFEGTIESNEDGSTYTVTGVCEEIDGTTLLITILPIKVWADEYKDFLQGMKTEDGPFFQSVQVYTDHTFVDFELKLSEENLTMARQEGFLKMLKFTTTIATSNMYLFDENAMMKKYASPEQILEEFFILGSQHYEKKKKFMLEKLERMRENLEEQLRFEEKNVKLIKRMMIND